MNKVIYSQDDAIRLYDGFNRSYVYKRLFMYIRHYSYIYKTLFKHHI